MYIKKKNTNKRKLYLIYMIFYLDLGKNYF